MPRPTFRLMLGATGVALAVSIIAGAAVMGMERSAASRLPVFWSAPAFALTDQLERPVRSDDLRGTVVVADFIYTRCDDICPLLSVDMQRLQRRLQEEGFTDRQVQLLSFTVDPEHDTPAVLRTYAERFQVEPQRWRFLTGPNTTASYRNERLGATAGGAILGLAGAGLMTAAPG